MNIFNKTTNTKEIIKLIFKKNRTKRYISLIIGIFLATFSYNLFLLPNNMVTGGVSGIAVILYKELNISPAMFILIANILLLVISFIFLGFKKTSGSIIGSLMFPFFLEITSKIIIEFDLLTKFYHQDKLLVIFIAAMITSFGYGTILKEGFSTGGTDIINQITEKYFHVTLGTALILNDGLIVLSGLFFFGPVSVMYAILYLYIVSIIIDRVILGVSESKMMYIITEKELEIKEYVIETLDGGITIFNAKSGTETKKSVLMCVIPTKNYYKLKEGILKIDKTAFFTTTDAYQVLGGH